MFYKVAAMRSPSDPDQPSEPAAVDTSNPQPSGTRTKGEVMAQVRELIFLESYNSFKSLMKEIQYELL